MTKPFKLIVFTALLLLAVSIGQYMAYSKEIDQIKENQQSKSDVNFLILLENFGEDNSLTSTLQSLSSMEEVNPEQLEEILALAKVQSDEYFEQFVELVSVGDVNGDLPQKEYSINQFMLSSKTQQDLIHEAYSARVAILNLLNQTSKEFNQSQEGFVQTKEKVAIAADQLNQIDKEINQLQSIYIGQFPPVEEVERMKVSLMQSASAPLVTISELSP